MESDVLLATADSCLLAPYELQQGRLDAVFGALRQRKLDAADLYFQYTRSESWSLEEGIVKSGSFGIEQGVGDTRYGDQNTDGSRSIRDFYDAFRAAGASAKWRSMAYAPASSARKPSAPMARAIGRPIGDHSE